IPRFDSSTIDTVRQFDNSTTKTDRILSHPSVPRFNDSTIRQQRRFDSSTIKLSTDNARLTKWKCIRKVMKLKERIKSKVDQLEASELRVVDILIDSLAKRRTREIEKSSSDRFAFLKVIELMDPNFLTSDDI